MKKSIWLVLVLFLCLHTVYADGLRNGKGELRMEQFAFIKTDTGDVINFSSDIKNLERLLGKPVAGTPELPTSFLPFSWEGLTLELLPNDYIIRILTVENSQFATIDGLKIGDDAELVEKTYGEPYSKMKRSTLYTYVYFDTEEVWNLLFYIDNKNKIEKMIILRGD
jgi:hypothetical protein